MRESNLLKQPKSIIVAENKEIGGVETREMSKQLSHTPLHFCYYTIPVSNTGTLHHNHTI